MKKKWLKIFVVLFALYCLGMYFYFFHFVNSTIPSHLKGTPIDPATFMSSKQLQNSITYTSIKNFLFFVITPLEWLFYFAILYLGVSKSLAMWSQKKKRGFKLFFYMGGLSLITFLFFLPIHFYSYRLSVFYNISTQAVPDWFKDRLISLSLDFFITLVVVYVLFFLVRKYKDKWWFYAWVLTVPFTIFMMFIQPVVIDPLYNDFYPLKNKQLEAHILDLAKQANISAEHVFEVDMSKKTNALNAYVTGIGKNARIVLWDTTLEKLSDEEILFVMAHEMAHYVKKDIFQNIGIYLAASFFALLLTSQILKTKILNKENIFGVYKMSDFSVIPLILLILSITSFVFSPLENSFSRFQEERADNYALKLTNNPKAGISAFQKLSSYGLSEINPPYVVKLFRYSHPPMLERLQTMLKKQQANEKEY